MRHPRRLALSIAAGLVAPAATTAHHASAKTVTESPFVTLAAGEGGVWAWLNTYELLRIDPRTDRVTSREDTKPALITDLATGEGGVWGSGVCGRANCDYGVVVRFDPLTGRRLRPLTRLGLTPRALAVGYGSVWVLGGRRVLRIDPRTRRMTGPPIWIGRKARDIAVGAGAVWVTAGERRGPTGAVLCDLVGIDPASARVVRRQPIACGPGRLAAGTGGVWSTASPGTRGLVGVTPFGGRMALTGIQLPGESVDVAADARRVWVVGVRDIVAGPYGERRGRGVLTALDTTGQSLGQPLALGGAAVWQPRVAAGLGAVWVANTPAGTITRVDAVSGRIVVRIRPDTAGP